MKNNRTGVTAHRGAALIEPENTLRGFRYALSLDVDRIETDVHLSNEGQLIVMHDETVDRTTDGTGRIADLSVAELKRLDAGKGERVPLLEEVFTLFQEHWARGHHALLQIELKGTGTAAPVVDAVKNANLTEKIVLTSFDAERLSEAKRLLPQATFGFLTSKLTPDPLEIAQWIPASAVHLHHKLASREWVERVQAAGLEARVWNIDEVERMRWAIELGVDGIGSNDPQLLLEVLSAYR